MLLYNTTDQRSTPLLTMAPRRADTKLVLDEGGFQQLLAAAYVLQENTASLASTRPAPKPNTTAMSSEIADIRSLVRAGLDVTQAAELITDHLRKIASASGVSLSLVSDGYLDCVAEAGAPARIPGSCVASHSLVATERLLNGEMFESTDAITDIRLSVDLCSRVGVGSLVASPIHEFGQIAGVLEVRWSRAHAFQESDVRSCRLMADLVTETLERKARMSKREAATAPRVRDDVHASKHTAVAGVSSGATDSPQPAKPIPAEVPRSDVLSSAKVTEPPPESCRVCGRPFGPREAFCGHCSMPRAWKSSGGLQSKWAALWYMQQARAISAAKAKAATQSGNGNSVTSPTRPAAEEIQAVKPAPPRVIPPAMVPAEKEFARPTPSSHPAEKEFAKPAASSRPAEKEFVRPTASSRPVEKEFNRPTAISRPAEKDFVRPTASSRPAEKEFTRPTAISRPAEKEFARPTAISRPAEKDFARPTAVSRPSARGEVSREEVKTRADLREDREYRRGAAPAVVRVVSNETSDQASVLKASTAKPRRGNAMLAAFVVVLLSFLVLWAGTAGPENSTLPWYQSLLVELGFHEAAHLPRVSGNPDTRVWLDLQTRVYYCPGSNLYGKTAGGRFTRQRGAQLDHFLPASGFVCQ
jgi:GAF domain